MVRRSALEYWSKGFALAQLLKRTTDFELAIQVLSTNRFRRALRPSFLPCPQGKRLLVFAPHQDDEIIGAGGVFLRSIQEGKSVQCIYVTDGATGVPGHTIKEAVGLRREEARRVWSALGSPAPIFLDFPCGEIELSEENAGIMAKHIHEYSPDTLFVPFFLEDPNDHRKVNHLLCMASQISVLPAAEVWAYEITTMICPNVAVDITDVMDRKYELMQMWESQNCIFDYAHQSKGMNAAHTLYCKGASGFEKVPLYVELFFVVPLSEYLELLAHYYGAGDLQQIYGQIR
ncbi:PIG-L family deacetylase [Acidobacteria bacterium AH-259-G07]|nr:PIG-L family deacetylase [Acidobacteria bacterium AH-259-G07]